MLSGGIPKSSARGRTLKSSKNPRSLRTKTRVVMEDGGDLEKEPLLPPKDPDHRFFERRSLGRRAALWDFASIFVQEQPAEDHHRRDLHQGGDQKDPGVETAYQKTQRGKHDGELVGEELADVNRYAVHDGAEYHLFLIEVPVVSEPGHHAVGRYCRPQGDHEGRCADLRKPGERKYGLGETGETVHQPHLHEDARTEEAQRDQDQYGGCEL